MTGGEVAAMAVIEAVVRLLPGVLGNEVSAHEESHSPGNDGLLEYPHYTRPADFRGDGIPRSSSRATTPRSPPGARPQARTRTEVRRPDILGKDPRRESAGPGK